MSKLNDHSLRVTVTLSLFPDEDNVWAVDPNEHRDAIVNALESALSEMDVTVLGEDTDAETEEITFGGELWDVDTIVRIDS